MIKSENQFRDLKLKAPLVITAAAAAANLTSYILTDKKESYLIDKNHDNDDIHININVEIGRAHV